jgi:hypothetical protein
MNAQLAGAIGIALYMCTPNAPGTKCRAHVDHKSARISY